MSSRLKRMQWLATGLLLAMAVVFFLARWLVPDYPFMGYVEAFAEAAMIGALADWFAVTALFRHPLGLPIPHTAVITRRKDEIGAALAGFVRDNFLVRDALALRVARVDFAQRIGLWLKKPENAGRMGRDLVTGLDWLLNAIDSQSLRDGLKDALGSAIDQTPANSGFAALVEVLVEGDHSQALIDSLVQFGKEQLASNKEQIRSRIKDRSPWWLPKFVDEEIYDKMVAEFDRILAEIGSQPDHEARRLFNQRLAEFARELTADPVLLAKGEALKAEFFAHPRVRSYFADVVDRVREQLSTALSTPDSPLSRQLEGQIVHLGEILCREPEAADRLNRWLRDVLVYLVDRYRGPVSEIISDTIQRWDAQATSKRIELHIGRDLQFIRINGTVVGGLVGLGLHTLAQVLS